MSRKSTAIMKKMCALRIGKCFTEYHLQIMKEYRGIRIEIFRGDISKKMVGTVVNMLFPLL
jgi:hypothetical protein